MTGTENAAMVSSDDFTAEEQAAFDAYRSGQEINSPEGGNVSQNGFHDGGDGETISGDQEIISPSKTNGQGNGQETISKGDGNVSGDDDEQVEGEIQLDANGNARDLKTGKFVPKSAMLRYKDEAKTYKQSAQQLRDNLIATRERLAILTEATAGIERPAEQAEQPPPDPETDIFGYAKWQGEQIKKLQTMLTQHQTSTNQQLTAYRMQDAFKSDVSTFRQNVPDFDAAYQHLVQSRDTELRALGLTDDRMRRDTLEKEAASIVANAIQSGQSPARQLYALALGRGYRAKAANSPSEDAAAKAQADLDRIAKGQQAAQSLRGAGSGSGLGDQLTVEKLASMSDEQYSDTRANYIAKNGKSAWVQLTGLP